MAAPGIDTQMAKRTYVRIISLNPSKIKGLSDVTFRRKPPVIAF
jgi:hypothetical protein